MAVDSIAAQGESGLTGDVTLSAGSGIVLTQVGQDIEIATTDGPDPPVADFTDWFDASIVRTLNPQGASGTDVAIWLNRKTGTLQYLAQASFPLQRPTYGARQIGDYVAVDFNGAAPDYLESTATVAARPMSFVGVFDVDTIAANNRFLFSSPSGNNRIGMFLTSGTGQISVNIFGVGNVDSGVNASTGPHVIGCALSATAVRFLYDGSTNSVADSTATSAGTLWVGEYGGGGANGFDGGLGEFMLWDRELTNQELLDTSAYLQAKWGTP